MFYNSSLIINYRINKCQRLSNRSTIYVPYMAPLLNIVDVNAGVIVSSSRLENNKKAYLHSSLTDWICFFYLTNAYMP